MVLYSYWRSSSAWRVRIALAYKSVDCAIVAVNLAPGGGEQHRPDFLARNPMAQVPVLEIETPNGPALITQSMAILEYLEETHPAPPLLPREPLLRARARQLAEVVNSGIQPLQNLKLQQDLRTHGLDPAPVVKQFIDRGLLALEELARTAPGRYLVGDDVTFADILLIPQLYNARRFALDVEAYPTLRRVERACESLPAFTAAHPNAQGDYDPRV